MLNRKFLVNLLLLSILLIGQANCAVFAQSGKILMDRDMAVALYAVSGKTLSNGN